jgi:single-stranded-DNA-specific exonuclease
MSFPDVLESLLSSRGVKKEDRADFLNPDYAKLHNPSLLPDINRAAERIIKAVKKNENIFVFSDYDADGIPGAVVLADFFKRIKYENVSFYIPHRHDEGFGLNTDAVDEAVKRGAKLLVTIDCGTADLKEVAYANKNGLDVIITDHHLEKNKLPKAFAVVNPMRADSKYPFKELCGAAVVYKLVQAILQKENFGLKEGLEKWSLDMVGIATLSDMVPLVGENRILAKYGLEVLRKSPRAGLTSLLRRLRIEQRFLTEDDVAFMITPRINAASRMGKPEDAFKLLSATNLVEADRLADHLEKINNERKGVVAALVKEAKSHMKARETIREVIVIGNPEWRPALLGLVANSLVEEYERPVFVWGRDGDGILRGSCRSYNGYHLAELMDLIPKSFIEYGGHAGAGGFSVTLESLINLEEKLSEAIKSLQDRGEEKVSDSIKLELKEICEDLWRVVSQLAPFGTGNEKPVFEIKNTPIVGVRQFGKEGNHLEVMLPNGVKAISFFSSPSTYKLGSDSKTCTLRGHLEKSYFMNRPELRLRIVDIKA